MPEYLAPGVYLEETSFRPKTIEGVSTSTAGFVGPTRFGPTSGDPVLVTSLGEFERVFGGLEPLDFSSGQEPNYMAHAVRAFFDNGGARVYIARVYNQNQNGSGGIATAVVTTMTSPPSPPTNALAIRARYPGAGGNNHVRFTLQTSQNVFDGRALRSVREHDVVLVSGSGSVQAGLYGVQRLPGRTGLDQWVLHRSGATSVPANTLPQQGSTVYVLRCAVEVTVPGRFPRTDEWSDLGFHPDHPESIFSIFGEKLDSRSREHIVPIVISRPATSPPTSPPSPPSTGPDYTAGTTVVPRIFDTIPSTHGPSVAPAPTAQAILSQGLDGAIPAAGDYEGAEEPAASGLNAMEAIADISIVAAPGSSARSRSADRDQTRQNLISHCERMRYRVAILDAEDGVGLPEIRSSRGRIDSTHAALYYPWVTVVDPVSESELNLPPSGFLAGHLRPQRHRARGPQVPGQRGRPRRRRFERLINKGQQDVLNPEGVNALRFFRGRGYRVWGARTASSDPEWKYVSVRRYFAYLERSIEQGTQWAVFEPNGEKLWARVRRTVEDFLFNEWKSGHLLGAREEAFFVRCDRSTMTQNDLDNGRLICLIGVSPLKPAEFVIFRIGQKTLDSQ